MKWKFGLLALALPMFGVVGGGEAQACTAIGQIKIALKLDDNGTGKALISEYDCAMMVPKTNCVVGVRLSDSALGDGRIAIRSLRFVHLKDGTPVQGFSPTANQRTTAAWGRVMDGTWYGFSSVFRAVNEGRGLAIEVSFTYDPSVGAQEVLAAFNRGHVGLAEGDSQGGIARGHMLEVVQIQAASLAKL
jgi:hypothetical protein